MNQKGLVTMDRKLRKDAFYLYKAAWNKAEPFVHLCGRRYAHRTEDVTEIKVYSNQPEVSLYADGKLLETQTGKYVFRFKVPITGEHQIEAAAGNSRDRMTLQKVAEPTGLRPPAEVRCGQLVRPGGLRPACYSVVDKLADIRQNPEAGAIVDQMMAQGASARGDVADAVKDNPALQRMMGRMTLLSLLKQGGAEEASIRQIDRVLQKIKKG